MKGAVRPKKALGQHFLVDRSIAIRIADTLTGFGGYDKILEVGPGTGMLTEHLIVKPWKLYLSEVDEESVRYLSQQPQFSYLKQVGDFLKIDLQKFSEGTPFGLIGNYPYNISTEIVFRMIENRHLIPEMAGMFQKEVAKRLSEGPGSKEYGITGVITQAFYEAEYLFTVQEDAFNPPPKVKSGVVRFTRREKPLTEDPHGFSRVVKTAFNQRRKVLSNALKPLLNGRSGADMPYHQLRAEQLSIAQFEELRIWLLGTGSHSPTKG